MPSAQAQQGLLLSPHSHLLSLIYVGVQAIRYCAE